MMQVRDFLVIGIGNPLRGDDGVGWAVVEALVKTVEAQHITAVATHQLLPELVETIHQASGVVFVDAAAGGEPGTVQARSIQPASQGNASSHQMSPAVLLAMGLNLYGRMPPASLLTISGQDFGFQEQLSPAVENAVAAAVGQIVKIITGGTHLFKPNFSQAQVRPTFRTKINEQNHHHR